MTDPDTRYRRSQRRKRNFIAKKLREDERFRPRRIEEKDKHLERVPKPWEIDDDSEEDEDTYKDDFFPYR